MLKCYAGLAQFFDVSVESFVSFLTSCWLWLQHAYFSFVMSNFLLCCCSLPNKPSANSELGSPLSEIFVQDSHLVYLVLVQSLGLAVYSRNLLSFLAVVVRFRESIQYFVSKIFIKLAKFYKSLWLPKATYFHCFRWRKKLKCWVGWFVASSGRRISTLRRNLPLWLTLWNFCCPSAE